MAEPAPTRVLFVCLGNICRSPAAEGVFLQLLSQQGSNALFVVDSAGTGPWHVGNPPDQRMQLAASRRGIELVSRARQIEPADLLRFDHILTMDAQNLRDVQRLRPPGGEAGETAKIEPLISYCRQQPLEGEIPDPYHGGAAGFERVLDLLQDACAELLLQLQQRPGRR